MAAIPTHPLSYREMATIWALEDGGYGVDAAPGGAGAFRMFDVQIRPLASDKKTRSFVQPFLGSRPSILTAQRTELSGKIELCGSGVAGAAAPQDALLQACGLVPNAVAATASATIGATATPTGTPTGAFTYARTTAYSGILPRTATLTCTTGGASGAAKFTVSAPAVKYLPAYNQADVTMTDATPFNLPGGAVITPTVGTDFQVGDAFTIALTPAETAYERSSDRANHKSASCYAYIENERHKLIGFHGTSKLVFGVNEYPYLDISGVAFFTEPDTDAAPTLDYTNWAEVGHANNDDTPGLSLFGHDLIVNSFEYDLANQVALKERLGRREVRITDWATKFSTVAEQAALADVNWYATAKARTIGALEFQHGKTAGNAIFVTSSRVQLDAPSPQEDDSDYMLQLAGDVLPNTGDDEGKIIFR